MILRPVPLMLLAATCALLFGVVEGLEIVVVRAIPWLEPMRKTSLDVVWVAPIVHLAVNAGIAAVLLGMAQLTVLVGRRLATAVFVCAGMMGVTRYTGTIGLAGCVILSAGAAFQASRLVDRVSTAALRRALSGLAFFLAITVCGLETSRWWSTRQVPLVRPPRPGSPNVLVIVMDTARADRLSIHGYPGRTPTIERIAAEGAMFEWAIAPSSWTLPSHASLFTGMTPGQHGASRVDSVLSPAHARLQQRFEASGYRTGAFIANNIFVIPEHGFASGFQVFDAHYVRSIAARTTWGRGAKAFGRQYLDWELDPFRPAATINGAFEGWVRQSPDRPFFAVLNWMDAHDPYHPGTRRPDVRRWARREHWTAADRAQLSLDYDDAIAYMDGQLSRLRASAIEDGWWDNTLLVLLSDHGESMADGSFEHGNALTLEQIHVPLVVRFPGTVPAGTRIGLPVSISDVPSTVMALTGETGAALPGASLTRFFGVPASATGPLAMPVASSLLDENYTPPLNLRSVVLEGYQVIYDLNTSTEHVYALSDTAGRDDQAGKPEFAGLLARARRAMQDQHAGR